MKELRNIKKEIKRLRIPEPVTGHGDGHNLALDNLLVYINKRVKKLKPRRIVKNGKLVF